MDEPLDLDEARKLIRRIVMSKGKVAFRERYSPHADKRSKERKISLVECYSVLKSGAVAGLDLIEGTWRYQVVANGICVVVAFRSENEIVVVTAMVL